MGNVSATKVNSERSLTVGPTPSVSPAMPDVSATPIALIIFLKDDLFISSVDETNGGRGIGREISPVSSAAFTSMNFDFVRVSCESEELAR